MKRLPLLAGFTVLSFFPSLLLAQNQTETISTVRLKPSLPYTVQLSPLDMGAASDQVPTLQSFAVGVQDGEWILLAGRTNGLHNFTGSGLENFPPAFQNSEIYVINPTTQKVWSRSIKSKSAGLTTLQEDSLSATNTQFRQVGDRLYIIGGYVYDRTADDFLTYDTLSSLSLPGVVRWVKKGEGKLSDHLRQIRDPLFQVTGGVVHINDKGRAFLIFGQNFDGPYTPGSNGIYTKQVRAFDIIDDASGLRIANVTRSKPEDAYRRRDLNVVSFMAENAGKLEKGYVALSGVFTPAGGAWTVPVEVNSKGEPSMANPNLARTFKQGMNGYACANFGLYSKLTGESHMLFFGGISAQFFNPSTGQIDTDNQLPFINGISSIVRDSRGRYRQHYMGEFPAIFNPANNNLPFLFGAGSELILADGLKQFSNEMLKLDEITSPTVVGHIFGGIVADAPNFGNSVASNRIWSVKLIPVALIKILSPKTIQPNSESVTIRGVASASVVKVEYRIPGQGWKILPLNNGRWEVKISGVGARPITVEVRGADSTGNQTDSETVVILSAK